MAHDYVDKPYVAADRSYIAIVLHLVQERIKHLRGKNRGFTIPKPAKVFYIAYEKGIRVLKMDHPEFISVYKPLIAMGVPYSVQVAARKYLDWGKRAGITDVAQRALTKIVKGEFDMSEVENTNDTQTETKKETPSSGTLGAALAEATGAANKKKPKKAKAEKNAPKSASTKNSTTASAKRPSRAISSSPSKEQEMKSNANSKKAAKKEAASTKSAKPARKSGGNGADAEPRGRPTNIDVNKNIKVLAEGNPRREGSKGHENWVVVKRYDGKSVENYLKAGGGADHLRWDINHKFVKLV